MIEGKLSHKGFTIVWKFYIIQEPPPIDSSDKDRQGIGTGNLFECIPASFNIYKCKFVNRRGVKIEREYLFIQHIIIIFFCNASYSCDVLFINQVRNKGTAGILNACIYCFVKPVFFNGKWRNISVCNIFIVFVILMDGNVVISLWK